MDLIGNAVIILRIIDSTGARRSEIERVEERVKLLNQKWPKILELEPPLGLRQVRNDYEHFDSRLDELAVSSKRKNIADMNIGPVFGGLETHENLRRFEGETLFLG